MTELRRQKFVVANWKMHTTSCGAQQLARAVVNGLTGTDAVTVVLCPPFPYLGIVGDMLKGTQIVLGAQNMYPAADGAFTGEVSPAMLLDLGCRYVLAGHSERRHTLNESDVFVNEKVKCALAAGLRVILCVGETMLERKAKLTEAVLDRQLSTGLAGVSLEALFKLSIAYEPVWAIGNSAHHATPEQARISHGLIRRKLVRLYGETWAQRLAVHYGGSVEPENAAAFLGQHGVNGVLVGGASLKADAFVAIVKAAATEVQAETQSVLAMAEACA